MENRAPCTALDQLEVVVVDCQTTGTTPDKGHLLEVAWGHGRAAAAEWTVVDHLVQLPPGARIPPRVARLTGIGERALVDARPREQVLQGLPAVPIAVAHFARFERAFLEEALPAEVICTHEIACRLMPGLPRRGLRALAGHFGHVMSEGKRAARHVRATIAVWEGLVERLDSEAGVRTLADLRGWMESTPPTRSGGRDFAVDREERLGLPEAPGVYRMLGKNGEVLYLGKATSLKRRVNSYFQKRRGANARIPEMLTQTVRVDVNVTATSLEAALLESDEIKRLAPPYNTALRERRPEVWFASCDLASVRPVPDQKHRLGPLPRADTVAPMAALSRSRLPEPAALGIREDLDPDLLRAGLALFCERHGAGSTRVLLRVGARLWRAREEESDETEWTAERVAARLEAALRQGAHLVRRGRWFARLGWSSLTWRAGTEQRRLVFCEGRIADPSAPAGPDRSLLSRLRCFDAATYDRMRVLTTELRRLAEVADEIELRLGAGLRLDRNGLARRLERV